MKSAQLHAAWFQQLAKNADGAIFLLGADGVVEHASSPVVTLLGRTGATFRGSVIYDAVHPDDRTALRTVVDASISGPGRSRHCACRLRRADESFAYVEGVAVRATQTGERPRVLLSLWDASERRRTEARLRRRARWFQALTRHSRDVITVFGEAGQCLFVSGSLEAVLGHRPDEMSWFLFSSSIHPDDRDRVLSALERGWSEGASATVEYRTRRKEGSYVYVESHTVDRRADPDVRGLIVYTRDISDRKARDPLTALPNRMAFTDCLETLVQANDAEPFAVLLLQLDRFAEVESGLGYHLADMLLLQLAGRLRAHIRPGDVVARVERDQFGILLRSVQPGEDVSGLAARIRETVDPPFHLGSHEVVATATTGIALGSDARCGRPDEIIRAATTALQVARRGGVNGQAIYESGMFHTIEDRFALARELRTALAGDEVDLHFQPVVDIRTRAVVAFEALLRWSPAARGPVCPSKIIEVAIDSGLMGPLGEWVMRRACVEAASWLRRDRAAQSLVVNVNIGAEQLAQPGLVEQVERILRGARLHPKHLTLEVTETSIIANPEQAATALDRLKALGVGIALDDFGTGYSSLEYLHRFPFDAIKVDRTFVSGLRTGDWGKEATLIRTIVAMGESLGTRIVAEGIETAEQLRILEGIGCHYGQGYYFSRPVPGRRAAELLRS